MTVDNLPRNIRKEKWEDGTDYDRYIQEELTSFRKKAWKEQICKNFTGTKKLHILDVGTGPGFLSCVLSEEGHLLTGIDASEGMIACAEKNAAKMGVSPKLLCMDVNNMEFGDESFDVVVSRNVTWTLEHPERVYREFYRILKKNGLLLIYDANWHRHFFDKELYQKVRAHEKECLVKYGRKEVVAEADYDLFETAPLTKELRPQWDERFLQGELKMSVKVEQNIGCRLYEQWEKELYRESPLFEICARKK